MKEPPLGGASEIAAVIQIEHASVNGRGKKEQITCIKQDDDQISIRVHLAKMVIRLSSLRLCAFVTSFH